MNTQQPTSLPSTTTLFGETANVHTMAQRLTVRTKWACFVSISCGDEFGGDDNSASAMLEAWSEKRVLKELVAENII